MGIIVYNGISSEDFGILVEHPPGYPFPERDVTITHVPGRNGDVVFDNGSYQNVDVEYELAIPALKERFDVMANRLVEWLHSSRTYARLEDSYEPEYFRKAIYKEEGSIKALFSSNIRGAGRIKVKFNCKPQRFLKLGEDPFEVTSSGFILRNPTGFAAKPIIEVRGTGAGNVHVGANTVSISDINDVTTINSDIMDCYSGTQNWNSKVTLSNAFPELQPGETVINFDGGVTSLKVTPNWWTL